MNNLLMDLYLHQAWADAMLWKGLEAFPPALKDTAIRNRQHHYHFTQSAFLWVARNTGEPFKKTKPEDYTTDTGLKAFGREVNEAFRAFLEDFAMIRKYSPGDLSQWGDWLVYGTALGVGDRVIEAMGNLKIQIPEAEIAPPLREGFTPLARYPLPAGGG